jgi:hypothetical protein
VSGPTDWVSIPYAAQRADVDPDYVLVLTMLTEPMWFDGTGPEMPVLDSQPSDDGIRVRLSEVIELAPAIRAIFDERQGGGEPS